jgi:hypothetical protein
MRVNTLAAVTLVIFASASVVESRQHASPPNDDAAAHSHGSVFITLPMTNGFADATHALVEAQELVRRSLAVSDGVRLATTPEDADVILTILGRGRGDVELTAALRLLDNEIMAPPVAIAATERYIETMLAVPWCGDAATSAGSRHADSCYRRIFVGVGFTGRDGRAAKKPASNSWEACADAVARDVRAWLMENGSRVRVRRE